MAIEYCTSLHRMHSKQANVCGGPPLSEIVRVPGYQPMHVYCFVKEQIDLLNAIQKHNIGVAHNKLWEISQVPVMSAFFDFDYCGDP
jgi:hypothetical protein